MTKEYSTWRRYYTSPDDKKTTTIDTEVHARHYNKIWEEGEIPNTWKHTAITLFLKDGKDP